QKSKKLTNTFVSAASGKILGFFVFLSFSLAYGVVSQKIMENELAQLSINEEEDAYNSLSCHEKYYGKSMASCSRSSHSGSGGKKTTVGGGTVVDPVNANPVLGLDPRSAYWSYMATRGRGGGSDGVQEANKRFMNGSWRMEHRKRFGKAIDPILGINLEGGLLCDEAKQVKKEKKSRRESDDLSKMEELNSSVRNRRLMDLNHLSSAASKRQADR
ncbi:hypothetical protein Gohar_021431, partial [Gossypium harknessii]|nr:hypothetical protein [Gossypium harknessii]